MAKDLATEGGQLFTATPMQSVQDGGEKAQVVDNGLEDFGHTIQRTTSAYMNSLEENEARDAMVQSQQLRTQYLQKMEDAYLAGGSIEDVKADFLDQQGKIEDNLQTKAGVYSARQHGAVTEQYLNSNAIQLNARATGERAKASLINFDAASLYQIERNPLGFAQQLRERAALVDTFAGKVSPDHIALLKAEGTKDYMRKAVRAAIKADPLRTQQLLRDTGKYKGIKLPPMLHNAAMVAPDGEPGKAYAADARTDGATKSQQEWRNKSDAQANKDLGYSEDGRTEYGEDDGGTPTKSQQEWRNKSDAQASKDLGYSEDGRTEYGEGDEDNAPITEKEYNTKYSPEERGFANAVLETNGDEFDGYLIDVANAVSAKQNDARAQLKLAHDTQKATDEKHLNDMLTQIGNGEMGKISESAILTDPTLSAESKLKHIDVLRKYRKADDRTENQEQKEAWTAAGNDAYARIFLPDHDKRHIDSNDAVDRLLNNGSIGPQQHRELRTALASRDKPINKRVADAMASAKSVLIPKLAPGVAPLESDIRARAAGEKDLADFRSLIERQIKEKQDKNEDVNHLFDGSRAGNIYEQLRTFEIKRLQQRNATVAGQAPGAPVGDTVAKPAAPAKPAAKLPTVSDQKSFDALPKGAHYFGPDGRERIK